MCYEIAKTSACSEKLSRSDDWTVLKRKKLKKSKLLTQAAKVEVIHFCALGINSFLNASAPHQ